MVVEPTFFILNPVYDEVDICITRMRTFTSVLFRDETELTDERRSLNVIKFFFFHPVI